MHYAAFLLKLFRNLLVFLFFFLSLTYLLNTYSHDSRFLLFARFSMYDALFSFGKHYHIRSAYIWFHIIHTYDTART